MSRLGIPIVIAGSTGVGKTTIVNDIIKNIKNTKFCISATTRKPRDGEKQGKDYYFLTEEQFKHNIREGGFIEWSEVYGDLYGTLEDPLNDVTDKEIDAILQKDVVGARDIQEQYPDGLYIYLLPPSLNELKKRLSARGDDPVNIKRRLDKVPRETELAFKIPFNYYITNINIDETILVIRQIIKIYRSFL